MKSALLLTLVTTLLVGCGSMKTFSVSGEHIKVEGEILPDATVSAADAKAAVTLAVDQLEKK